MRALLLGLLAVGLLQPPAEEQPTEQDPVKADWKNLEGVWSVVSAESSGLKASAESAQASRLAFAARKGGQGVLTPLAPNQDPRAVIDDLRKTTDLYRTYPFARLVRINPTKKPKEMNLITGDRTVPAVYELAARGDELAT